MGFIIETIDIHALVIGLGRCPEIVIAAGCRPRWILLMADIGKMVRNPPLFRQALLTALIADRPEDDRRVVAIAANHRAKILLRPFIEKRGIAVWLLGIGPCISKLIHN